MDEDLFKRLILAYLPRQFHRMGIKELESLCPPDSITLAEKTGKLKRIDDILQRYAPCDPTESDAHAFLILLASGNAASMYEHWDADKQARNVERVKSGLDTALKAINELPPQISSRLMSGSEHQQLAELAERIESDLPAARRLANTGEPIGQTDWRALSVARAARDLWKARTSREAPFTVDAAAPGPFGRFLQDLYDELGISTTARSGLRSLGRIYDQLA